MKKWLTKTHACNLLIASSVYLGGMNTALANDKNTAIAPDIIYTRTPFMGYASQMEDGLTGGGKYQKPVWNLHDALKLPEWLSASLDQRTRYESLDGRVNAGAKGGDQQVSMQTILWLQAKVNKFRFATEFLDARAYGSDSGSGSIALNASNVDSFDILQGYAAWADQNVSYSGIGVEIIAGRQTLDLGSRRLVGRTYFSNAVNSFTGGKIRVTNYSRWQFTGFATMPVIREPTNLVSLQVNTQNFDIENTRALFAGGFLELSNLALGINNEMYGYVLNEGTSTAIVTRSRRYFTPGTRFFIKPAKAKLDFSVEGMGQIGSVHSIYTPTQIVDHQAWYTHVDMGYTFDMPWSPRLALEYDYASGNNANHKNIDQRFDPLYGARRFDFGPTGIYGAFARSNINTPGYRINASPRADVSLTLDHRFLWLASATDCWGGASCSGSNLILSPLANGKSGDFVGQQLELVARYDFNSSLSFETGWTHLFKGRFAKQATAAPNSQDVDYFYVQSQLRF